MRAMASFRKLPSGRWQASVRRKGHPAQSRVFAKKALAERWARQVEEDISMRAVTPEADRTLLSALIDKYLLEITPRKRARQSETSHLRIVSSHLGRHHLSALTAQVVLDYVDLRIGQVGADSVRKELGKLAVVIDAGIALWGIDLPANPVHTAKGVLKVTKTLAPGVRRDRRPTAAELEILLSSHIGPLVEFAIETAMRCGELANMLPEHLDGDVLAIPKTKTDAPRIIPLSPRARQILAGLEMAPWVPVWRLRPQSMSRAFMRICDGAKIVDLRFHDLRHEGASRLFEQGLSIQEVASITGHADWASLKRYTHLCPRALAARLGSGGAALRAHAGDVFERADDACGPVAGDVGVDLSGADIGVAE